MLLCCEIVLTARAGADDKEEFMATMVDQNNRNKRVGEMHNIQGWTKSVESLRRPGWS